MQRVKVTHRVERHATQRLLALVGELDRAGLVNRGRRARRGLAPDRTGVLLHGKRVV
jgi:hypothetical protein